MHELVVHQAVNIALLMVTYRRDLAFAEYAFRAVTKFAAGFGDKVVVVPSPDVVLFRPIARPHGFEVVGFEERPGKGMLHHMVKILEADLLCPTADAILHLDADCLFTAPVTPEDYLDTGRPIILRQRYEELKAHANRYSWKACVRAAVGIDAEWETMCRHPSVYRREVYNTVRRMIEEHTLTEWRQYVLSCRNTYPQTFAEFPTLGAVANHCYSGDYSWVDVMRDPVPPSKMTAFWSHGGLEMVNDRHPTKTARQAMDEILAGE